jgi:hypothetical protein
LLDGAAGSGLEILKIGEKCLNKERFAGYKRGEEEKRSESFAHLNMPRACAIQRMLNKGPAATTEPLGLTWRNTGRATTEDAV